MTDKNEHDNITEYLGGISFSDAEYDDRLGEQKTSLIKRFFKNKAVRRAIAIMFSGFVAYIVFIARNHEQSSPIEHQPKQQIQSKAMK